MGVDLGSSFETKLDRLRADPGKAILRRVATELVHADAAQAAAIQVGLPAVLDIVSAARFLALPIVTEVGLAVGIGDAGTGGRTGGAIGAAAIHVGLLAVLTSVLAGFGGIGSVPGLARTGADPAADPACR